MSILRKTRNVFCMGEKCYTNIGVIPYKYLWRTGVRYGTTWPSWKMPEGHDTGIIVYNSTAKAKVPLVTRERGLLTWYMCGPTVYGDAHIGHGLCYLRFDIIRRILTEYFKINVVQVMGITDVDNKIINKANYFKVDISEIARHFESSFFRDMMALGVARPTLCTRVSENIPFIIAFIVDILDTGFAYCVADGSVYFNNVAYRRSRGLSLPDMDSEEGFDICDDGVREFSATASDIRLSSANVDNGRLSSKTTSSGGSTSMSPSAAEVAGLMDDPGPGKRHPIDFALWKGEKTGEPSWPAPFGRGRPGWHIECSTMACGVFGRFLDVHSGGQDLLFPHHYCEEAQSCVRHSASSWTRYWWHSGHLTIDSGKMSKSVGNVISIQELLKTHSANVIRQFALTSHYTNSVMYRDSTLLVAASQVAKIQQMLDACYHYTTSAPAAVAAATTTATAQHRPDELERLQRAESVMGNIRDDNNNFTFTNDDDGLVQRPLLEALQQTQCAVDAHLRDDFNTAAVITAVLKLVTTANIAVSGDAAAVAEAISSDAQTLKSVTKSKTTRMGSQKSETFFSDGAAEQDSTRRIEVHPSDVLAVRNYVLGLMRMFGFSYNNAGQMDVCSTAATDGSSGSGGGVGEKLPDVMTALINFRQRVRDYAMLRDLPSDQLSALSKAEKKLRRSERATLLAACDDLRAQLKASALIIKDTASSTSWAVADDLTTRAPSPLVAEATAAKKEETKKCGK